MHPPLTAVEALKSVFSILKVLCKENIQPPVSVLLHSENEDSIMLTLLYDVIWKYKPPVSYLNYDFYTVTLETFDRILVGLDSLWFDSNVVSSSVIEEDSIARVEWFKAILELKLLLLMIISISLSE